METEIFRDIEGFEGLYQVSNFGRVKSLNYHRTGKEKILQPFETIDGYLRVLLYRNGKRKKYLVHRLVASAFLENPYSLPCVNHKDENPSNNFVGTPENDYKDGNLEWCSIEYNNNYGTRIEKIVKARSKPVLQFLKTGSFIREWSSSKECGRNGFSQGHVSLCCNGKRKSHKGYIWKYKETL